MDSYQDFFNTLDQELGDSPYAQRLREELQDHIADDVFDRQLSGEKSDTVLPEVMAQLGSPQQIMKEYRATLRYQARFSKYAEVLIFLVASWLLYAFLNIVPMMLYGLVDQSILNQADEIRSFMIPAFLMIPVTLLGAGLFYFFTLPRIMTFFQDSKQERRLGLMVILAAPLYFLLARLVSLVIHSADHFVYFQNDWSADSFRAMLVYGALLQPVFCSLSGIIAAIGILYVLRRAQRRLWLGRRQATQGMADVSRWLRYLLNTICIITVAYIVLTTILQWLSGNYALLQIRFLGERTLVNFLPSAQLYALIPWSTYIWPGVALSLLLGGGLYQLWHYARQVRQQKQQRPLFPWLSTLAVTYLMSLLFFTPPVTSHVQWHVPVSAVSTQLNQRHFGPFVRLVTYLQSYNNGGPYHYVLDQVGNNFFVREYLGADSTSVESTQDTEFVLQDITSVDEYYIHKTGETDWQQLGPSGNFTTNPGIDCVGEAPGGGFCERLEWNGHTIYTQAVNDTYRTFLGQVQVSQDQQWLLLHVLENGNPTSSYIGAREMVYLVDLHGLEQPVVSPDLQFAGMRQGEMELSVAVQKVRDRAGIQYLEVQPMTWLPDDDLAQNGVPADAALADKMYLDMFVPAQSYPVAADADITVITPTGEDLAVTFSEFLEQFYANEADTYYWQSGIFILGVVDGQVKVLKQIAPGQQAIPEESTSETPSQEPTMIGYIKQIEFEAGITLDIDEVTFLTAAEVEQTCQAAKEKNELATELFEEQYEAADGQPIDGVLVEECAPNGYIIQNDDTSTATYTLSPKAKITIMYYTRSGLSFKEVDIAALKQQFADQSTQWENTLFDFVITDDVVFALSEHYTP